jgi:N-acetylmuramoyl-L-alanine amidase
MSVHPGVGRAPWLVEQIGYFLADRCGLKNNHAIMLRLPYLVRQERARYKYALARVFGLVIILVCAAWHAARSEEPTTHPANAGACVRSAFHVIVDVGHTVDVPGADSARGATEYSFNLQLADVIKQALVDAGFDKATRLITAAAAGSGRARYPRQQCACRPVHFHPPRFGTG